MQHMYITATADLEKCHSSTMHLVLPHLYKHPYYLETYKAWGKSGEFLMQDNSIFELKTVVPGSLMEYAAQIGAHEVMVPEVLRDAEGCLNATEEFLAATPKPEGVRFAACLQGKTWGEVAYHYRTLVKNFPEIDTICIPYGLEFDCFNSETEEKLHSGWNRFSNILKLVKEGKWDVTKTHHLLGLHNPAELAMYWQFGNSIPRPVYASIRSNDSSICYKYGLYGAPFIRDAGFLHRKIKGNLDHSVRYEYPRQWLIFQENRELLTLFMSGCGGERTAELYTKFAKEYGEFTL
jgi:hypothetical protein